MNDIQKFLLRVLKSIRSELFPTWKIGMMSVIWIVLFIDFLKEGKLYFIKMFCFSLSNIFPNGNWELILILFIQIIILSRLKRR